MREKIRDLAIKAGFEYDPRDCNFYVRDSAQYINKEIYTLGDLFVEEVVKIIYADDKAWTLADTIRVVNTIEEHFGVR